MRISKDQIEKWFTYQKVDPSKTPDFIEIREKAKELAYSILRCSPPSPDQSAAIRKLREVVMTANAAIACEMEESPVYEALSQVVITDEDQMEEPLKTGKGKNAKK